MPLTNTLHPVDVAGLNDADGDGIPNRVEATVGRDPLVKDNDVFADARLFAMQQYRDFLQREGEPTGVDAWTAALAGGALTRETVVDFFATSLEHADDFAPVVRLYFACFRRPPDLEGLLYNVGLLRKGPVTREMMASYFAQGPEFMSTYGALDNTQFVTLLYQNVLGRALDAAGLSYWVSVLAGGAPRGRVVLGLSDSAEFLAASANEVFATALYVRMLGRAPDAAEFPIWIAFLDSGPYLHEYMIRGFRESAEYYGRFLP
jgi:hypothetical protein